ncbi:MULTISPECIES: hypothetical protein [unclassified Parabacteroides]|uniref:hypothetical protein n=1 Tax=unclassified Parabacteroides TaxID=2649774 RepID=UPI002474DCAF|nr:MULTISPECIES: hypothetical protein [unclassified Parabacteroides]
MKKVCLLVVLSVCITAALSAQTDRRMPQAQMEPKEIAEQKAEFYRQELGLDDKQYKKVYKVYLSQAKALQPKESEMPAFSGERPAGGPPGGGQPGGGSFGGGRPSGGMPPGDGDFNREGRGTMPGRAMPQIPVESEKDIAKRDKKMKKILSEGQYLIWLDVEQEIQRKEEERKQKEERVRMFTPPAE